MKKNKQNIFPIPKKIGRRDWGSETLLVLISKIIVPFLVPVIST